MERQPTNERLSDPVTFEADGLLSDGAAQAIADRFSGDALRAFAATGRTSETLEAEIARQYDTATDSDDKHALTYLLTYVTNHPNRAAVEGWSQQRLTQPEAGYDEEDGVRDCDVGATGPLDQADIEEGEPTLGDTIKRP